MVWLMVYLFTESFNWLNWTKLRTDNSCCNISFDVYCEVIRLFDKITYLTVMLLGISNSL